MKIIRIYAFLILFFHVIGVYGQLDYLNSIRRRAGLHELKYNRLLALAAQKHSEYMEANGDLGHVEKMLKKDFYAARPVDRALRVGYPCRAVEEDAAYNEGGAREAIDGLLSVVYHRFSLLTFDYDEAGMGESGHYVVLLMGNSQIRRLCREYKGFYDYMGAYYKEVCMDDQIKIPREKYESALSDVRRQSKKIVVYPYPGQDSVGLYSAEEIPNPVPSCYILGYPVTVAFNPFYFSNVKVTDFTLVDGHGRKLKTIFLNKKNDPNDKLKDNQFAILPVDILKPGSVYTAQVKYRSSQGAGVVRWSFRTVSLPGVVYVDGKKEITLQPGRHDLYVLIIPRSCNDRNFNQAKVSYTSDRFSFSYESLILLHVVIEGKSGQKARMVFGNGYELGIFLR